MANLKEIRNRITSIKSTMQITSAMKMVSAAKLKKAQDAITAMRPYSSKLTELLQNLSATLDGDTGGGAYSIEREVSKVLLVVVTSNRGLCGGFNSSITKTVIKTIAEKYADKQVEVFAIGKKGGDVLAKEYTVVENRNGIYDDLTFDNVAKVAEKLMNLYVDGSYDKIELVYNQFKNAATQLPQVEQFLPIKPIEGGDASAVNSDYIFEPSKLEIVEALIPKSLKTQLYKGIRDSFASEHGARMTAMQKETDEGQK